MLRPHCIFECDFTRSDFLPSASPHRYGGMMFEIVVPLRRFRTCEGGIRQDAKYLALWQNVPVVSAKSRDSTIGSAAAPETSIARLIM